MNIDKKLWEELINAQEDLLDECANAYDRMNASKCEHRELACSMRKLEDIMEKIERNKNVDDGSYEDNIAFSPRINRD